MKVKTSEIEGVALDWAVADAEGYIDDCNSWLHEATLEEVQDGSFHPSISWAQGGPIIEREWLDVMPWPNESDEELRWQCKQHDSIDCVAFGPTPLIAAMRCYVASKLGDEVEIPEELL
jgi:hypothetical protein